MRFDLQRVLIFGSIVIVIVIMALSGQLFENLDAHELMVIQAPISGLLTWYTNPGVQAQNFGKVTKYPKRSIYRFEAPVRFNDGGHATMSGSIQYEYPLDVKSLTEIHTKFGSAQAVEQQLVKTVTDKAIYMAGPLMSSRESYAEKRNALIYDVEDQIQHGIYKTVQRDIKVKDPLSGQDKTQTIVEIVMIDGKPARSEEAVLTAFHIAPFNFALTKLDYDETVEKQISQQQQITMDVQTAIASAKKAEQAAITVEKEGQAKVMTAKYEKEQEKIRAVVDAQKELEVQTLRAKAAEQYKRQQILEGEGDAAKKSLVMNADGALNPKLETYKEVQRYWAEAFANFGGQLVPTVVMGGEKSSMQAPASGAQLFMEMLGMKAAHDLGLSLEVPGAKQTVQGGGKQRIRIAPAIQQEQEKEK